MVNSYFFVTIQYLYSYFSYHKAKIIFTQGKKTCYTMAHKFANKIKEQKDEHSYWYFRIW